MNSSNRQSARGEHVTRDGHSFEMVEADDVIGLQITLAKLGAGILTGKVELTGSALLRSPS